MNAKLKLSCFLHCVLVKQLARLVDVLGNLTVIYT